MLGKAAVHMRVYERDAPLPTNPLWIFSKYISVVLFVHSDVRDYSLLHQARQPLRMIQIKIIIINMEVLICHG